MKNPISKQVLSHLEYLGYVVEDVTEKENIVNLDFITGKSETKSNLLVRISHDNTIFISARYVLSDSNKLITEKFLKTLNTLNSISIYTKVYYQEKDDKEVSLVIETYVINYDKLSFITVIDALESDIRISLTQLSEFYSESPQINYGQVIADRIMHSSKNEEVMQKRIGF